MHESRLFAPFAPPRPGRGPTGLGLYSPIRPSPYGGEGEYGARSDEGRNNRPRPEMWGEVDGGVTPPAWSDERWSA